MPTPEELLSSPWRILEEILEASKTTNVLLAKQNEVLEGQTILLIENNQLLKEIVVPSPEPPREAVSLELIAGPVHDQGEEPPMSTTLKNNQQCKLTLVAKDADGNPATVENPVWAVSDETILQLVGPEDDDPGLERLVKAVGPAGEAKVTVTCDADLGEGVRPLTGFADFVVQGGEAVVIELQPGEITDQPTAPPTRRKR